MIEPAPCPSSIPLVLGSSSSSRAKILNEIGWSFSVQSPPLKDEKAVAPNLRNDPSGYVMAVAQAKMDSLIPLFHNQKSSPVLVIASDQVVSWNGKVREKPVSEEECVLYLKGYADAPAITHCGIVVWHSGSGKRVYGTSIAEQCFTSIPDSVIQSLIKKGDVMYCCGGFLIDDGRYM